MARRTGLRSTAETGKVHLKEGHIVKYRRYSGEFLGVIRYSEEWENLVLYVKYEVVNGRKEPVNEYRELSVGFDYHYVSNINEAPSYWRD